MAARGPRRAPEMAAADVRPLVVLIDGPMVHQWYYEDEWAARVESAEYMAARGQRRSPCLDYVPGTGAPVRHPSLPTDGRPLQYRPQESA